MESKGPVRVGGSAEGGGQCLSRPELRMGYLRRCDSCTGGGVVVGVGVGVEMVSAWIQARLFYIRRENESRRNAEREAQDRRARTL